MSTFIFGGGLFEFVESPFNFLNFFGVRRLVMLSIFIIINVFQKRVMSSIPFILCFLLLVLFGFVK